MATETTDTSIGGELAGLKETAHLLRSLENARRLLSALNRAARAKGKATIPTELRREVKGGRAN